MGAYTLHDNGVPAMIVSIDWELIWITSLVENLGDGVDGRMVMSIHVGGRFGHDGRSSESQRYNKKKVAMVPREHEKRNRYLESCSTSRKFDTLGYRNR